MGNNYQGFVVFFEQVEIQDNTHLDIFVGGTTFLKVGGVDLY